MLKKLGKKITNNFGLKLLATLFAVVLWVVVINIDDPTIVLQFTTSVTAENTDYLTAQNKYFEEYRHLQRVCRAERFDGDVKLGLFRDGGHGTH